MIYLKPLKKNNDTGKKDSSESTEKNFLFFWQQFLAKERLPSRKEQCMLTLVRCGSLLRDCGQTHALVRG